MVLAMATAGLSSTALAAPPPPPSSFTVSREATKQGVALVNEGKLSDSLPYFKRAYELAPGAYDTAFNLGFAYFKLKQFPEAARFLALAVERLPSHKEESRSKLEGQLEKAQREVVTVIVDTDAEFGRLYVDGESVATLPLKGPVYVDPGPHVVLLEGPAGKGAPREIEGRAGQTLSIRLQLAPNEGETTPAVTPVPGPTGGGDAGASGGAAHPNPIVLAVGYGLGGAAAVTSAILGGLAAGRAGDEGDLSDGLRAEFGEQPCQSPALTPDGASRCDEAQSRAGEHDDLATAGLWVGVAGGAMLLGTATYHVVTSLQQSDADEPATTEPAAAFTVVPLAGAHTWGLAATGQW